MVFLRFIRTTSASGAGFLRDRVPDFSESEKRPVAVL